MFKSDIVFSEVDPPENLICECGHKAPFEFKRDGPDSESLPTRFWHMKGNGADKIICEPCMILVNYLAAQKRKNKNDR
jgi:hypothetical protein